MSPPLPHLLPISFYRLLSRRALASLGGVLIIVSLLSYKIFLCLIVALCNYELAYNANELRKRFEIHFGMVERSWSLRSPCEFFEVKFGWLWWFPLCKGRIVCIYIVIMHILWGFYICIYCFCLLCEWVTSFHKITFQIHILSIILLLVVCTLSLFYL